MNSIFLKWKIVSVNKSILDQEDSHMYSIHLHCTELLTRTWNGSSLRFLLHSYLMRPLSLFEIQSLLHCLQTSLDLDEKFNDMRRKDKCSLWKNMIDCMTVGLAKYLPPPPPSCAKDIVDLLLCLMKTLCTLNYTTYSRAIHLNSVLV